MAFQATLDTLGAATSAQFSGIPASKFIYEQGVNLFACAVRIAAEAGPMGAKAIQMTVDFLRPSPLACSIPSGIVGSQQGRLTRQDVLTRFEELKSLRDGWLDGDGIAPSTRGIDRLTQAFDSHFVGNIELPYVYPTPDGNIRFEWTIGDREISLDVELVSLTGYWHAFAVESGDEEEKTVSLVFANDWRWIARRLGCFHWN